MSIRSAKILIIFFLLVSASLISCTSQTSKGDKATADISKLNISSPINIDGSSIIYSPKVRYINNASFILTFFSEKCTISMGMTKNQVTALLDSHQIPYEWNDDFLSVSTFHIYFDKKIPQLNSMVSPVVLPHFPDCLQETATQKFSISMAIIMLGKPGTLKD